MFKRGDLEVLGFRVLGFRVHRGRIENVVSTTFNPYVILKYPLKNPIL